MNNLDEVLAAVTAQTTQIESMKTFIAGLEAAVATALADTSLSANDQAKLDAVFAGVNANTASVMKAIDSDPTTV